MIFILGLDGLEHDLVEKMHLKHLMQNQYGKLVVPINEEKKQPLTPEVWGSFLVGKRIRAGFAKPRTPLSFVFSFLKFLGKHINLRFGLSRKLKRTLPIKIHGQYNVGFTPLNETTFIDIIDSQTINAPYYDYDHNVMTFLNEFGSGKKSLTETMRLLKAVYRKCKHKILYTPIRKEVVFAYLQFPDALQHLLFLRPMEIRIHYMSLNVFIQELKRKVPESAVFIIISDHGFDFKRGQHTSYGFFSSNIKLKPKPSEITDFFKIILKEKKV